MALKILKATDPVSIKSIKMLIYGRESGGKTSLAFTAQKPILFDFDEGVHRAANRKDAVQISSWSDVFSLQKSDLDNYDTIIVDTVGKMLDVATNHIVASKQKGMTYDGALTQRGYGRLKVYFQTFLKKIEGFGKDIILVAHETEQKITSGDGQEITIYRPKVQGSSVQIIKSDMDLIGHLTIDRDKRKLNFDPTEASMGKNCAMIPLLSIPDVSEESYDSYIADVIQTTKDYLNTQSKSGQGFYDFKKKINACETLKDFDNLMSEIKKLDKDLQKQVKRVYLDKTKNIGITWNKDTNGHQFLEKEVQNG